MLKKLSVSRHLLAALIPAFLLLLTIAPPASSSTRSSALTSRTPSGLVGLKPYYLALGNSLAFGQQPNGDYDHGYVADLFPQLQHQGVQSMANMACPRETSQTFIHGGCPDSVLRKWSYPTTTPQLTAALAFLQQHSGKVSPVTLDIGANDVLPDLQFDPQTKTCNTNIGQFQKDLANLDENLRSTILPQLHDALTVNGQSTGDLVMMNYYDSYQNYCPQTVPFLQTLNAHLAADVHPFGLIVDVFEAFGGAKIPNRHLCSYTWICSPYHDVHATDKGYQVIAATFKEALER
jgi:lysophospholipase L1-like esterase